MDETGGMHGVRDLGLLKSALARPQATFGGLDLYPDIFHQAAALMESLVSNHPFLDGNKRTAITATALFLKRNGLRLKASQKDLVKFTMDQALKKNPPEKAATWLENHSVEEE